MWVKGSAMAVGESENLEIVFDGPALANHSMDVRELAPALLGLSALHEEANRILNGGETEIAIRFKSEPHDPGCVSVLLEVVQSIGAIAPMLTIANLKSAKDLLEIIGLVGDKGLIQFMSWLRGRTVTKVEPGPEPGMVAIHAGNDVTIYNNGVLQVFNGPAARRALTEALAPLEREGIESFKTRYRGVLDQKASKDDLPSFSVTDAEEVLEEKEDEGPFQIIKPSFDGKYTWKLSDGAAPFDAYVRDQRFLDRLERRQIAFAKGDVLRARYRKTTWRTETGLKSRIEILRVIDHIPAPRQLRLPIDDGD